MKGADPDRKLRVGAFYLITAEKREVHMIKYEYETGLCKQLHYNGLWSVQYEGIPGHFKKIKMVCPCIKDGCDRDCEVFKDIPEIKAADQEWHMRDER